MHGFLAISEGLQLRQRPDGITDKGKKSQEPVEHHPELKGKSILLTNKLKGCLNLFTIPSYAIGNVSGEMTWVREGRYSLPAAVAMPPHVIVSAARTFAIYSDEYLIVPPRQIGIAGSLGQTDILRAIALFLSSDFVTY